MKQGEMESMWAGMEDEGMVAEMCVLSFTANR